MSELIPFMSVVIQHREDFCSLNKLINFSFCSAMSSNEIMTRKLSYNLKNACLGPLGSGDNLTFDIFKVDGF